MQSNTVLDEIKEADEESYNKRTNKTNSINAFDNEETSEDHSSRVSHNSNIKLSI